MAAQIDSSNSTVQTSPTASARSRSPITRAGFLAQYPWASEYADAKPVDDLWVFEYDHPPEHVWPVITDTSTLNRRLELPAMTFEEREGKLFGSATYAGVYSEWEEIPWEWEHQRYLESARRYSKGVAHYVRGVFLLEALPGNRSRYTVYFGWIPRGITMRLLLKIGLGRLKERYGRVVGELINEHVEQAQATAELRDIVASAGRSPASYVSVGDANTGEGLANAEQLAAGRKALLAARQREALVDRVLHYVNTEPDDVLYRIRVRRLAQQWQVDEKELLLLFLHGTRAGLFYLTWDVICPHCRGVRSEVQHLGELPEKDECDVCDIDFDTQGINSFEVTFHVHASLRVVEKQFFCSAEPAKKDHIKLQLSLRPGESRRIDTLLGQGIYRMRVQGERVYQPLELDGSHLSEAIDWQGDLNREEVLRRAPRPAVILHHDGKVRAGMIPPGEPAPAEPTAVGPKTFIIEENMEDREMLRPVDLFNFQDFRDLFSREALAADIQLDVGLQTILFTDIVGSSRYYQDRGDQGAFAEVRKHFVEIYRIVKAHNGAVVKTIGDAAMAAFSRPLDAILAAIELQEYYSPENAATDLRLRVSMHLGPCLAVNLNSNIDYFGNTVNLAAKLQSLAESGQVAFSQAVLDDSEVRQHFVRTRTPLSRLKFIQPWDQQRLSVYRFQASAPGQSPDAAKTEAAQSAGV